MDPKPLGVGLNVVTEASRANSLPSRQAAMSTTFELADDLSFFAILLATDPKDSPSKFSLVGSPVYAGTRRQGSAF